MKNENDADLLLRKVCKMHTNKVNQVLSKVKLHKGQPLLLKLLINHDGIPQSSIAKELEITPATVSAMVKRMEKSGFIVRRRNAEDERVSNIYLTEEGRALRSELNNAQKEMEGIVFNGFSDEEKEILSGYLERMIENLK
ncbi:MAG: MarR family winged helix-turn-helix transcriptional regulator [Pleomorphochaeta sp.]